MLRHPLKVILSEIISLPLFLNILHQYLFSVNSGHFALTSSQTSEEYTEVCGGSEERKERSVWHKRREKRWCRQHHQHDLRGREGKERSRGGGEETRLFSCVSLEFLSLNVTKRQTMFTYCRIVCYKKFYQAMNRGCDVTTTRVLFDVENISPSPFDSLKIDCQRLSILFSSSSLRDKSLEINAISSTTADDCCVMWNYRECCLCIRRTTGDLVVLSRPSFPFVALSFKQHKLYEKICIEEPNGMKTDAALLSWQSFCWRR